MHLPFDQTPNTRTPRWPRYIQWARPVAPFDLSFLPTCEEDPPPGMEEETPKLHDEVTGFVVVSVFLGVLPIEARRN